MLSVPSISLTELSVTSFAFFALHFWIMFFIALTIFLPYWVFGWLSFWKCDGIIRSGKDPPYKERVSEDPRSQEYREYHRKHYAMRVLSWAFLLLISCIVYGVILAEALIKPLFLHHVADCLLAMGVIGGKERDKILEINGLRNNYIHREQRGAKFPPPKEAREKYEPLVKEAIKILRKRLEVVKGIVVDEEEEEEYQ